MGQALSVRKENVAYENAPNEELKPIDYGAEYVEKWPGTDFWDGRVFTAEEDGVYLVSVTFVTKNGSTTDAAYVDIVREDTGGKSCIGSAWKPEGETGAGMGTITICTMLYANDRVVTRMRADGERPVRCGCVALTIAQIQAL